MLFFERDVELYVSTVDTGFTTNNTVRLKILSGSSISYTTKTKSTYNYKIENAPNRVEEIIPIGYTAPTFNFVTYAKPYNDTTNDTAVEKLLLYSLTGNLGTEAPTSYTTKFTSVNQLPTLFMYLKSGALIYKISNVVVESAEFSFEIDNIVSIAWQTVGLTLEKVSAAPTTYTDYTNISNYIVGKLTTVELTQSITANSWKIPAIKGSVKLSNNVQVISKDTLDIRGTQHLDHFVKERKTEVNLLGYLRTGNNYNNNLFELINSDIDYNDAGENINTTITLGKSTEQNIKIEIPNAQVQLPEIKIQEVISSNILITSKKLTVDNDDTTITYTT